MSSILENAWAMRVSLSLQPIGIIDLAENYEVTRHKGLALGRRLLNETYYNVFLPLF